MDPGTNEKPNNDMKEAQRPPLTVCSCLYALLACPFALLIFACRCGMCLLCLWLGQPRAAASFMEGPDRREGGKIEETLPLTYYNAAPMAPPQVVVVPSATSATAQ